MKKRESALDTVKRVRRELLVIEAKGPARKGPRPSAYIYEARDAVAKIVAEYICEGGRTYDLQKNWHVRFDRAHVPGQSDHLHVYLKKTQQCVINRDGTPSHGTNINLPSHVRTQIHGLGLIKIEESTAANFDLQAFLITSIGKSKLAALVETASKF